MRVSVVIPALNEAGNIGRALGCAAGPGVELIVVDGGSVDGTSDVATRFGARVVRTGPGRGLQMDAGAQVAQGDVFVFLHADTMLPPGWLGAIESALEDERTVAGAFTLEIDSTGPALRLVELMVRARSKWLGLVYGDQALFVRRSAFERAGGFRRLPLMEDVDCVKRLRGLGTVVVLDASVSTSARRWAQKGVLRNTLRNLLILFLYSLGVSPGRLYRWYYGRA